MEVCSERLDKVAQSILEDSRTPAHNSHPPTPGDSGRHQTTSSQVMMDVDSGLRGPPISEKDDHPHPHQHQYPSPASAPAHPPAPSSTAPSSAHHSPVPQSAQFPKKIYPPTSTRPSSPTSRPGDHSTYANPTTSSSIPGFFPRTNGHRPQSPSMQEVQFDALQRLQVQISHHEGGLQSQRRNFDLLGGRVDAQSRTCEVMAQDILKLADQMSRIESLVLTMRQELHSRPTAPVAVPAAPVVGPRSQSHIDNGVLEAFANSLDHVSTKVNEVDGLKVQLEILKRRIKLLEHKGPESGPSPSATTLPTPPSAAASSYGHSKVLPPQQPLQHPQSHSAAGYHNGSPATDVAGHGEPRPEPRFVQQPPQPQYRHLHAPLGPTQQEVKHFGTTQPQQTNGWVPVNPGAKRQLPNGAEGSPEVRSASTGSPKRPKLAPLEPRLGPESGGSFDRMDVDKEDHRNLNEGAFHPVSTPSSFVPFSQMVDTAEGWHSDPRSTMSVKRDPPRRCRGGGRGRGRKSLPADTRAVDTPEWDKPPMDWTGTQILREGYYGIEGTPSGPKMPRSNSLVRRGSGGGGPLAMRPVEIARPSTASSMDPYAHTKKTRTKPFRNAQGILIRKDGLPDMRSQSSAANLRKVHARKEQERIAEMGVNGSHSPNSGLDGMNTPQPMSSNGSNTPEAEHATGQDRHDAIMRQIFPDGISDQLARRNYHDKFFPSRSDPAVGPQIKHEAHSPPTTAMVDPVGEQARDESHRAESQSNADSGKNPSPRVNGEQTNGDHVEGVASQPQPQPPPQHQAQQQHQQQQYGSEPIAQAA
ncbi:hypothetical protein IWX90DRAFT_424124 [Phyllosticta citrichinensis]|uniref:Uncharacterized protein n=1 Tax=Phyllosticta citrichinensis TaxID=1130410 RepID=A0ABR1Y2K4_9PEZI